MWSSNINNPLSQSATTCPFRLQDKHLGRDIMDFPCYKHTKTLVLGFYSQFSSINIIPLQFRFLKYTMFNTLTKWIDNIFLNFGQNLQSLIM